MKSIFCLIIALVSISLNSSAIDTIQNNDISDYFYNVYPKGSNKPVRELYFEINDKKNGYLKATGAMEGYFIYSLFTGEEKSYLVEQATECGPACTQKFKVFQFSKNKMESVKKIDFLYPKKNVDTYVSEILKKTPKGANGEVPEAWYRMSRTGKSIDILVIDQNPGSTKGKVNVYPVGTLSWNGIKFIFKKLSSNAPVKISIKDVL
jgi:hypothetical protein